MDFKKCINGHYYSINLENCPYCGNMSPTAKPFGQEDSGIAVDRTMKKCPQCGRFSSGDICIYCGANLYEPLYKSQSNIINHQEAESDKQQMGGYKVCRNSHYYKGDFCPYCGETLQNESDGEFSKFSVHRPYLDIIPKSAMCVQYKGHVYVLTSNSTASLLCYSEDAFHLYEEYLDWLIEAFWGERFPSCDCRFVEKEEVFYIPRSLIYQGNVYEINTIEKGAFAFCKLSSIIIPDSIKQIKRDAFYMCDGIKTLIIPDSVKDLANGAVSGCKDLETITWRGLTYENDINEPFLFPDNKDKYAVVMPNLN